MMNALAAGGRSKMVRAGDATEVANCDLGTPGRFVMCSHRKEVCSTHKAARLLMNFGMVGPPLSLDVSETWSD